MSSWISASSSPKRNSASVLDSSVLPTPEGPAKMNEPPGRFGSFRPARVRRIARESALTASSWPMTRLCSYASLVRQAAVGLEVLPVDRRLLALADVADLVVVLAQVGGRRHPADPQPRAGL